MNKYPPMDSAKSVHGYLLMLDDKLLLNLLKEAESCLEFGYDENTTFGKLFNSFHSGHYKMDWEVRLDNYNLIKSEIVSRWRDRVDR